MSNDELQTKKTDSKKQPPIRKSRIRRGLHRQLNTEKYQQLLIIHEIEEEIEWKTLQERDQKIKNWETLHLKDYKQYHDRVLDELGLEHKKAFFKDSPNTCGTPTPESTNDLDSLDSLDSLEK